MKIIFERGSFRDPAGKVFYYNEKVYRGLTHHGYERFEKIKKGGILQESISKGFLINTKIVPKIFFNEILDNYEFFLEHEKINFVSYPYEWTFNQLKDAAIHHLNFQIYLLEKNFILLDASAYNIQFINTKPIFVDVLSIDNYVEGSYWLGYKQFCENFLNPLIISSKKNINFNNWFRGNLEGISTTETNSVLSFIDKFSPNIFVNVFLLYKIQKKTIENPKQISKNLIKVKTFSKKSYIFLLKSLLKFIEKLKKNNTKSVWQEYSTNNTYKKDDVDIKKEVVSRFSKKNNFNLLADLGCNDGTYSFLSLENGTKKVIGFDYDLKALNDSFIKAKGQSLSFQPVYFDATNPSPNQGWNEKERKNIFSRAKFDGVIALALVHHLSIAKNVPLDEAVSWIIKFAPKGIIEFVPKSDETVKIMLLARKDIFKYYDQVNFEKYLLKNAKIVSKTKLKSSERLLYEYSCI